MGVALDVFAPGHLGELTQVVPPELVDAVLEETGRREQRLRLLPSRVGVYFILALGLFEHLGAKLVWAKLVAGLGQAVAAPSEKALRDLRRRIGAAPLQRLFEVLAGPLAQPSTTGVRYRRWRTVAFDGCSSIPVADHERNLAWLGRATSGFGQNCFPRIALMTLCETGTRGLIGAVFGPTSTGESTYARQLARCLTSDMLVLADRGFQSNALLQDIVAQGAQFLIRCSVLRQPPVLALLPDGSYLTQVLGIPLRVVEAQIRLRAADGTVLSENYRLLTTLTDHRTDPAGQLVRLYHERWEIECAYLALRHTILKGRVLRSMDPAGVAQEMWGLLALYQALRHVMVTAVETRADCDPDRAGFTTALEAARDTVVQAAGLTPAPGMHGGIDLVGHIGIRVLRHLLPARRPRVSARVAKRGKSRYYTSYADTRPRKSTPISSIDITVAPPTPETDRTPERISRGRWGRIRQILAEQGNAPMHGRVIARALGVTEPTRIRQLISELSRWARGDRLIRTAPSTFKLRLLEPLTPAPHP